jgi:hypothetical protein
VSWLRIDDAFPQHPKLVGLARSDRWTWLEVLAYCARYRTEGKVPPGVHEAVPAATAKTLQKYVQAGLLDEDETGLRVHDWSDFNPKDPGAADRMKRVRERAPQPSGGQWERARRQVFERDNGVCVDCGERDELWNADHEPHREDLVADGLSIYDIAYIKTRCHSCHAKRTRREATERDRTQTEQDPNEFGASRVGARARTRPVPSRNGTSAAAGSTQGAPIAAELARIGITDRTLIAAAGDDPLRAGACLAAARTRATSNPAGLFRTLLESGDWPTATANEAAPNPRQGSPRELHPDACPDCEIVAGHTTDCPHA